MATQTIDIRVVDKTQRSLSNIEKRLGQVNNSLIGVGKVAGIAATALGAIGGANLVRGIVNTTARFQDLRTALSSVTGSARDGAAAFDFVSQFATQTQFGVDTLSEAFIKLKAAGIEPTQELLTTFTDTAAVTTDQIGTLTAITDLFARTTSGGLGLEELNRLADRGVPVFRILEEQLGITRLEVSEFGKTAEGAQKITEALTRGLNNSFGGATAKRVNNLSTAMSNFQIGVANVADAIGQGGLNRALTELINQFNGVLARIVPLAKQFGEELGFGIFQVTKFLKENNFAFGNFLEGAKIALSVLGGAGLIKILQGVTNGFKALTLAMAKNPLGLLAVAAATAITYLSMENGLGRTIAQVRGAMQALGEMSDRVASFLKDQLSKVIQFLTSIFDRFVNGIIDGYNAIADFVGFLPKVESRAADVRQAIADVAYKGFNAIVEVGKDAADILIKYKDQVDLSNLANSEAGEILAKLTKAYQDAGMTYDEATAKSREEYNVLIGKTKAYEDHAVRLARITDSQNNYNNAVGTTKVVSKELQGEIDKLIDKYDEFRFTSEEIANKTYSDDLAKFKEALEGKAITQTEYNELVLAAAKSLNEQLASIEEENTKKYEEEMMKRIDATLRGNNAILSAGEKNFLQKKGQEERTKSMVQDRIEFEKKSEFEKTQFGIQQAGEFFSALGQSNKKAFEAAKAFNIANAIMNTYAGATKALATYPPPFNFIAAAAVVASGLAQVSAIRSQQYQARQRGGALNIGQGTVVGEDGPELIVPKQPGTVIPREVAEAIGGMNGGGDNVTVNFNISTVDAEDFDSLLVKRRGTIVGIINQALQKKGKQGVA